MTPCGGLAKVSSFLALFGGNKLHVAVLTDYGHGDKTRVRELKESNLLQAGHVFTADMYAGGATEADVEDILGRTFYSDLINTSYRLKATNALPKKKPTQAPERVTLETKQHFQGLPPSVPEYNHYHPARYLLQESASLPLADKDVALDRFESLFKDLNALL